MSAVLTHDELAQELNQPEPDVQPVPVAEAGYVTLRMPRVVPYSEGFEFPDGNLDYGPAGRYDADHGELNIKFTADGMGDGYAIVRADHPLLGPLQRSYPQVSVVDSGNAKRPEAYVCEIDGKEFRSVKALVTHKKSHE